ELSPTLKTEPESKFCRQEWPASSEKLEESRQFLIDTSKSSHPVLIVPDRDADGLCASLIVMKTLQYLGRNSSDFVIHFIQKGGTVHDEFERKQMQDKLGQEGFIYVVDSGSRGGRAIVDGEKRRTIIIDHHFSTEFPENSLALNASHYEPVATSSLLSYILCKDLHPLVGQECAWLAITGTYGDLSASTKFTDFPNCDHLEDVAKKIGKKNFSETVSLLNAPRRSPECNAIVAWNLLVKASGPTDIIGNKRLEQVRQFVQMETEKWSHVKPVFSKDGKIAILTIKCESQVHPVIAQKWATFLKSSKLELVACANVDYMPGRVNFSCRIARCAVTRGDDVNLISLLKEYANKKEGLPERIRGDISRPQVAAYRRTCGTNFVK
ncbi:hypothetical protein AKO1_001245, partial [Acrasis kona]